MNNVDHFNYLYLKLKYIEINAELNINVYIESLKIVSCTLYSNNIINNTEYNNLQKLKIIARRLTVMPRFNNIPNIK